MSVQTILLWYMPWFLHRILSALGKEINIFLFVFNWLSVLLIIYNLLKPPYFLFLKFIRISLKLVSPPIYVVSVFYHPTFRFHSTLCILFFIFFFFSLDANFRIIYWTDHSPSFQRDSQTAVYMTYWHKVLNPKLVISPVSLSWAVFALTANLKYVSSCRLFGVSIVIILSSCRLLIRQKFHLRLFWSLWGFLIFMYRFFCHFRTCDSKRINRKSYKQR